MPSYTVRDHLIGTVAALILWLVSRTWRYEVVIDVQRPGEATPVVLAFWHNQQLMMAVARQRLNWRKIVQDRAFVLISRHRDGRLIARAIEYFGIHSVAGSSSRGASSALRALIRVVKSGFTAVVTPDGPRGPVYQAKSGVVQISRVGGVPILPLGLAVDRAWRFRSWDKLILPKFGARVVIVVGDYISPTTLGGREEEERSIANVTAILNSLTDRAQQYLLGATKQERL